MYLCNEYCVPHIFVFFCVVRFRKIVSWRSNMWCVAVLLTKQRRRHSIHSIHIHNMSFSTIQFFLIIDICFPSLSDFEVDVLTSIIECYESWWHLHLNGRYNFTIVSPIMMAIRPLYSDNICVLELNLTTYTAIICVIQNLPSR